MTLACKRCAAPMMFSSNQEHFELIRDGKWFAVPSTDGAHAATDYYCAPCHTHTVKESIAAVRSQVAAWLRRHHPQP